MTTMATTFMLGAVLFGHQEMKAVINACNELKTLAGKEMWVLEAEREKVVEQFKSQNNKLDGIRGPVESVITPEACLKIGHATGIVMKELGWNTVVIGKDTRISGYTLEPALVSGLTSAGMHVFTLGPLPTNGLAMLTKLMKANMGIMITASHNPYYDNGL